MGRVSQYIYLSDLYSQGEKRWSSRDVVVREFRSGVRLSALCSTIYNTSFQHMIFDPCYSLTGAKHVHPNTVARTRAQNLT